MLLVKTNVNWNMWEEAIIANPILTHSTYFTIALIESAINPEHFGPIWGNCTVLFVLNFICWSRDMHKLFTCDQI